MRILLILLVLLLPAQVFAGNTYVKGNVGIFMFGDSEIEFESGGQEVDLGDIVSNTGFGLSAAVGRSLGNFDVELEFAYREADFDEFEAKVFTVEGVGFALPSGGLDGAVDIKTLMGNGIYNFKSSSSVTPYVGAGLGIAWVDADKLDDSVFAYQFLAGIDMAMNDNFSLLLGYRYLGASDISGDATLSVEYSGETYYADGEGSASIDSHNFEVGLKYSF